MSGMCCASKLAEDKQLSPLNVAVALANKNARIVWALMTSGERYREPQPMAAQRLSAKLRANEVGKGKEELMNQAG